MATALVQLSRFAWVNLGTGPMFIQSQGTEQPVFWCASAADPGSPPGGDIAGLPQHQLGGAGRTADVNINFRQPIWARGQGAVVVTT